MQHSLSGHWVVTHVLDLMHVWTAENALINSFQLLEHHTWATVSPSLSFPYNEWPDSTKTTKELSWCIYPTFPFPLLEMLPYLLPQSWSHQHCLLGTDITSACLLKVYGFSKTLNSQHHFQKVQVDQSCQCIVNPASLDSGLLEDT